MVCCRYLTLMLYPPESKVSPLPISATFFFGVPDGLTSGYVGEVMVMLML